MALGKVTEFCGGPGLGKTQMRYIQASVTIQTVVLYNIITMCIYTMSKEREGGGEGGFVISTMLFRLLLGNKPHPPAVATGEVHKMCLLCGAVSYV